MKSLRKLFGRTEKRQGYADQVINAALAAARGGVAGNPTSISALETAAGAYARAFAVAEVSPRDSRTGGLTPVILSSIARDLIRKGESLHVLEVINGQVRLRGVGQWDVYGPSAESDWLYRCYEHGPSSSTSVTIPSAGVLHLRYAVSHVAPWRGISPLQWASSTGALASNLEGRLSEELSAPVGLIIPMPQGEGDASDLTDDISKLKGYPTVVETAYSTGDPATRPAADWRARRIGADPPESLQGIRDSAGQSILAACGVPPSLFVANSDGTAQRESLRRFVSGSCQAVARLIETELSAKLETEVKISFGALWSHDLTGRARAFQGLVKGGMELSKAAALAGLLEAD